MAEGGSVRWCGWGVGCVAEIGPSGGVGVGGMAEDRSMKADFHLWPC